MIDTLLNAEGAAWPMLSAFLQVLLIDLVLAGDNAVAVGLAAGGLPSSQRRKVILWGLAAAVTLRIGFALIATQLLGIIGLTLAGGLLLLWVCWKMWRELRAQPEAADADLDGEASARPAKSFRSALFQVVAADLSMSLDNVLAVAGAAREHPVVLVFGLILSIALMGVAASWIARLLHRWRWIGYAGLLIVLYVALHMIWDGHRDVVADLGQAEVYNNAVPRALEIDPTESEGAHGSGEAVR
ncbi:TerC family protein [Phenylobacterium sp.]|uniref:TerC family protein n=1 Tax=Phenylobacterium sp. TaxID=1871053 RepID=UPI0035AE840B